MISDKEILEIANGWIQEASTEPYILKHRYEDNIRKLDEIIYQNPLDAIKIFEAIGGMELTNWAYEGLSAGPLRTFLMLYDGRHDVALAQIKAKSEAFAKMYVLACKGL